MTESIPRATTLLSSLYQVYNVDCQHFRASHQQAFPLSLGHSTSMDLSKGNVHSFTHSVHALNSPIHFEAFIRACSRFPPRNVRITLEGDNVLLYHVFIQIMLTKKWSIEADCQSATFRVSAIHWVCICAHMSDLSTCLVIWPRNEGAMVKFYQFPLFTWYFSIVTW